MKSNRKGYVLEIRYEREVLGKVKLWLRKGKVFYWTGKCFRECTMSELETIAEQCVGRGVGYADLYRTAREHLGDLCEVAHRGGRRIDVQ
jgi:hypothetical protein